MNNASSAAPARCAKHFLRSGRARLALGPAWAPRGRAGGAAHRSLRGEPARGARGPPEFSAGAPLRLGAPVNETRRDLLHLIARRRHGERVRPWIGSF